MGIYIKGMEMPEEGEHIVILIKSNGNCSYFRQEDTEYGICGPMQTGTAIQISTPHGRLIDEDTFLCRMDDSFRMAGLNGADYRKVKRWLKNSRTILEAEEQDDI